MKSLLLVIAALVTLNAFSQETRKVNKKTFKVTVVDSSLRPANGYLLAVSDSNLVVLDHPVVFDMGLSASKGTSYAFENVSSIKIRRKGAVGRGILIGAISGAALGAIVGAVTYKKPPPCDPQNWFCLDLDYGAGGSASFGSVLGGLGGAALGAVFGAIAKKTFIIGGRREDFKKFQISVLDRAYGTK